MDAQLSRWGGMPAEYCGQVGIPFVSAVGVVRVLQADGVRARYLCAAVAGRGGRRSLWVVRLDAIKRGGPGEGGNFF